MSKDLTGKIILITGASSGLGGEIAKQCAMRGASVILVGRNEERLEDVAKQCRAFHGEKVWTYVRDLSQVEEIPVLIQQIEKESGGVDVLINNAGFGLFETLVNTPPSVTKEMFQVNVLALIALTQAVLPTMKQRGGGHIVNVASQAGKLATPKSSIYAATKHAVIGFSNSLRMEVASDRIAVTTINPGPINTSFFDQADQSGTYARSIQRMMLNPEKVAEKTVDILFTNRREVNLPWWMNAGSKLHALFPTLVETVGKKGFNQK
ncbi:SDR family NAD(P)-dependent oxidoreductase [Jeotgalibacillus soli]|uniref:Oxidoreductase n=1 Tax=Jeotgalibacillus soli TaxID=889306 RepID=A0A0C2VIF2_9BACL|nr:SDR family oxidoreductase [Jeotgalibacillus soli]KIL44281.1 oxidoreductase [Jeotgalibacillus soli]